LPFEIPACFLFRSVILIKKEKSKDLL